MTLGTWRGRHVRWLAPRDLDATSDQPVAAAALDAREWPSAVWASSGVLAALRQRVHPAGVLIVPFADDQQRDQLRRFGFDEVHDVRPATVSWLNDRAEPLSAGTAWQAARKTRTAFPGVASSGLELVSSSLPRWPSGRPPRVAYVICVRDEAPRLPAFFASLKAATRHSGCDRHFVFVVNGCSDGSQALVDAHVAADPCARALRCAPGIAEAFITGINASEDADLIGKLDADTTFDPGMLDRLELAFGVTGPPRVTYAEPISSDPPNDYAIGEQQQDAMSSRSYYVAKACLIDATTVRDVRVRQLMLQVGSDDIVVSFVIALREGLDAIVRVPGATVRSATLRTFDDLVRQQSRAGSALQRLTLHAPDLAPLVDVFDQRVLDDAYARTLKSAARRSSYTSDWLRLPSTKGQAAA